MTANINMEIFENEGMVVIKFDRPLPHNEISMTHDVAKAVAEKIAKNSYEAAYGMTPKGKSQIAEQIRSKLLVRVTHVIKNLSDNNRPPGYIANEVVDTILSEAL